MLKKILIGLGILIVVLCSVAGYFYYQFSKANKPPISDEDRAWLTLIPLPAKAVLGKDSFELKSDLAIQWKGHHDARLQRALDRFIQSTGISISTEGERGSQLIIRCDSASNAIQQALENESYSLVVTKDRIELHAPNSYGILHGLETLRQLVYVEDNKISIPSIEIDDKPRYGWRGIMLDVCRHWISKEAVLRNLDAMAAVKMNVLHWHLSEYQAFRVESKLFPKLHELGSEGNYYTQNDIKEVIAYASDRGIRILPEFDMPGHTTSFFVGYPDLASAPGPYQLDLKFGVLNPVMDPTREEVYTFIDSFIGEMSTLFPDLYFHIGGDEVNTHDWDKSGRIQAFMKEKGMKDAHDLQNYFNTRLKSILAKHNKKMIGWDEILHPDLGTEITVQSWRGQKSLFEAVQKGSKGILSSGWYLDYKLPAGKHYEVDPEILPGSVNITPDSLHWQKWNLNIYVSETPMKTALILYGTNDNLRGVFSLVDNTIGFEKANRDKDKLNFSFSSSYGDIDVDATFINDSIQGKMSLGLLSFDFTGEKIGGNDMPGTFAPVVEQIKPLTDDDKKRILGGEAPLWTELVTERNVDSRLWPRSAAIAEKLWSPQVLTKDVEDMYRRLNSVSTYLTLRGARHQTGYEDMLKDFAGNASLEPVKTLIDVLEEVKYYERLEINSGLTTHTLLNEVADVAQPESYKARKFNKMVEAFIQDSTHHMYVNEILIMLEEWNNNDPLFSEAIIVNPRLEKIKIVSDALSEFSLMGLNSIYTYQREIKYPDRIDLKVREVKKKELNGRIKELDKPYTGVLIAIIPGIKQLVNDLK